MSTNSAGTGPPRRRGPARVLWRFVSWFLEGLYTRWAWGYDLVASLTSMGQWWQWQKAVIPELAAGRILELGFGTGRLMEHLKSEGYDVFGLDRSRQMNRLAKTRLLHAELPPRLVRGDALRIPFASGTFESVIATFPSDYFYREQTLAEIWRALRPGGKAIVIPLAVITGRSLWDRVARLLYILTGQSPSSFDASWLDQLKIPGFELAYQRVEQERADVLRVTLEKVQVKNRPEKDHMNFEPKWTQHE